MNIAFLNFLPKIEEVQFETHELLRIANAGSLNCAIDLANLYDNSIYFICGGKRNSIKKSRYIEYDIFYFLLCRRFRAHFALDISIFLIVLLINSYLMGGAGFWSLISLININDICGSFGKFFVI